MDQFGGQPWEILLIPDLIDRADGLVDRLRPHRGLGATRALGGRPGHRIWRHPQARWRARALAIHGECGHGECGSKTCRRVSAPVPTTFIP